MPGIWFNPSEQTAASASGTPDYAKALREGFQTAYMPKQLAENLLKTKLLNQINKPKAEHAEDWLKAQMDFLRSGAGLRSAQTEGANAEAGLKTQQRQAYDIINDYYGGGKDASNTGSKTWGVDNQGRSVEGSYEKPLEEEEEEQGGEKEAMEPPGLPKKIPPRVLLAMQQLKLNPYLRDPVTQTRLQADQTNQSKEAQAILDEVRALSGQAQHVGALDRLMKKNPNVTGWIPKLMNTIGMGGSSAGEFQAHALPLQGSLGKELSSKGGAVVAGMAEAGKPSIGNNPDANKGLITGLTDKLKQAYNFDAKEYKRLTGKKLPYNIEDYLNAKETKIIKGKTYTKINGEWYE